VVVEAKLGWRAEYKSKRNEDEEREGERTHPSKLTNSTYFFLDCIDINLLCSLSLSLSATDAKREKEMRRSGVDDETSGRPDANIENISFRINIFEKNRVINVEVIFISARPDNPAK
jgi:hypothetical protein